MVVHKHRTPISSLFSYNIEFLLRLQIWISIIESEISFNFWDFSFVKLYYILTAFFQPIDEFIKFLGFLLGKSNLSASILTYSLCWKSRFVIKNMKILFMLTLLTILASADQYLATRDGETR